MGTPWFAAISAPRTAGLLATLLIFCASPLVGTAVILLCWWPVFQGRLNPASNPDVPLCTRCGYNVTGNVSGVCPECGTPVAVAAPGRA